MKKILVLLYVLLLIPFLILQSESISKNQTTAVIEEPICNPYYTFYNECLINTCRGGYGGTGPIVSILHFNPQVGDYEIPAEFYVGETYTLNGFMLNDNYCKITKNIDEEHQKYKTNPTNFTLTKYADLKFSFIVQISKIENGKSTITQFDSFSNIVKPGEQKMHSFQWSPKEKGQYIIERFIVYDIKNPIPLAPKHVTYVDVQEAYGKQDLLTFLISGFDNSVPPNGDKTFKIEYSDIVESINTISDETLDFWGFDIKLKENSEDILNLKIPKNFPTPASYTNSWYHNDGKPFVMADGEQVDYKMIDNPCYFHYEIPVKNKINLEISFVVIATGTWQLYSPIEYYQSDPCYSKVFYEPSIESPLKQFKAGIALLDIKCKSGLQLVEKKTNGKPLCIKNSSLKKLTERGFIPEYNGSGEIPEKITESDIPSDFSLLYYFGIDGKNIYDSKKDLLRVDRVCDPPIELKIELSPQEKEMIWNSIEKNDFFSFTSFTQNCDESGLCLQVTPEAITTLSITANGKEHAVQHRDSYRYKDNPNYLKFEEISQIIHDILRTKDDYKNLPAPRCAYQ